MHLGPKSKRRKNTRADLRRLGLRLQGARKSSKNSGSIVNNCHDRELH